MSAVLATFRAAIHWALGSRIRPEPAALAPKEAEVALGKLRLAFLIVAVPEVAPIVREVAAPAKFKGVAVVLKTSKLAELVVTEVEN